LYVLAQRVVKEMMQFELADQLLSSSNPQARYFATIAITGTALFIARDIFLARSPLYADIAQGFDVKKIGLPKIPEVRENTQKDEELLASLFALFPIWRESVMSKLLFSFDFSTVRYDGVMEAEPKRLLNEKLFNFGFFERNSVFQELVNSLKLSIQNEPQEVDYVP
jgi:hypothetical protein